MSRARPNQHTFLPYPLHRIHEGGHTQSQWRILYRDSHHGEWMTWAAFQTEKRRNKRYAKDSLKHLDITFATQNHKNPIDSPSESVGKGVE